jgi:hypothetical protein
MGTKVRPELASYEASSLIRFCKKFEIKEGGCWEWIASTDGKFGYGKFHYIDKDWYAHRFAYFLFVGSINDLDVCHKCDNPKCVNPEHLFLGTHQDNMKDKTMKGRCIGLVGETNHFHKLTVTDVIRIKASAIAGVTCRTLATQYEVTYQTIWNIVNEKNWVNI